MKKKVLVLYARYGSGHEAIAKYVANYLSEDKNLNIYLLDISDYGNFLGRIGVKVMDFVGKYRPALIFNFFYELMDHRLTTLAHNQFAKKSYDNETLRNVIVDYNPDIVISTHFYASNIITYYKKLGLIKPKLYTIITDYRPHECWIRNKHLEDGYIVGNSVVKEELIERGVESKKIYPFGLPLNIDKIKHLDKIEDIYKRYNLKKDKKIYLFFGGSSVGSMYYYDYFKTICKLNLDKFIIFISGKNEKLRVKCEEYVSKNKIDNVLVLGYSKDVLNLMKISTLVISKPGGATVTESLEMRLPMILVPGVGGQEKYNARFITRKRYGLKVRTVWGFKRVLERLEVNDTFIKKAHERLKKLDNNESVEKIHNLIVSKR